MRTIRLLPIVIFATAALLVFKVVGLATHGGYVLVGTSVAQASGGGDNAPAEGSGDAAGVGGDPTITDTAPVAADTAPTMSTKPAAGEEGGHGSAAAPSQDHAAAPEAPAPTNSVAAAVGTAAQDAHAADPHAQPEPNPSPEPGAGAASPDAHAAPAKEPAGGHGGAEGGTAGAVDANGCPIFGTDPPPKADAGEGKGKEDPNTAISVTRLPGNCPSPQDAVPMTIDSSGKLAPMATAGGGSPTDQQILARLSERRGQLDAQAKELDMRSALLDAAQKRLDEREASLKALQDKLDSQAGQGKADAAGQFTAIVSMYETMKPADAANIFNNLDMSVLVEVARKMNPRKMAPIMAKMDPTRAQALTVQLVSGSQQADASNGTAATPGQLPQIVGQ